MTELTDRLRDDTRSEWAICNEAADEIEHLALDLQTERAAVVALRAELDALREDAERFISLAEAMIADDDTQDTIIDFLKKANPDPRSIEEVRAAIDAARKATP